MLFRTIFLAVYYAALFPKYIITIHFVSFFILFAIWEPCVDNEEQLIKPLKFIIGTMIYFESCNKLDNNWTQDH